nr:hypothetical protein [Pseudomonas sp. 2FG]
MCFALEGLPTAFTSAVDFLGTWLRHEADGGLLDTLRKRGWCDALEVRLPYRHAGQALLSIDFSLAESVACERGAIRAALLDWLAFFAGQDDWSVLRGEYAAIVRHRLGTLSPLALARYWSEWQQADCGLGEEGVRALRSLLAQLQPQRLIELTSDTREIAARRLLGFTLRMAEARQEPAGSDRWAWRLPAANPFLQPQASSAVAPPRFDALRWLNAPRESAAGTGREQGTVYLRWSFAAYAPPSALFEVLQVALRPTVQLAQQAGLEVRFERQGKAWQLQVSGAALALPGVLAGLAELLRLPPEWAWSQGLRLHREQACRGASEALIHQLWQRLPELFGTADEKAAKAMPTLQALVECWRQSSLQGLAVGLPIEARAALDSALWRMPGQARTSTEPQLQPAGCYHWLNAGLAASESALLLFLSIARPACRQRSGLAPSGAAAGERLLPTLAQRVAARLCGVLRISSGRYAPGPVVCRAVTDGRCGRDSQAYRGVFGRTTRLSHSRIEHFSLIGALQTLLLMLAVWWVWIFTTWGPTGWTRKNSRCGWR